MIPRISRRRIDGKEGFINLREPVVRLAYVDKGDRDLPEFVLAYRDGLPTPITEPELYDIPHEKVEKSDDERHLQFPLSTVVLITEWEDDWFRNQYPDVVDALEVLCVDSSVISD